MHSSTCSRQAVFTILLSLALLASCKRDPSESGPSAEELRGKLATELPAFLSLNDFDLQVSENIGNKVDPVFASRFQGAIKLESDTFLEASREDGAILIVPHLKAGETRKIYGKAVSALEAGSWQVSFELESDPVPDLGKPKDSFTGGQVLIRGSKEEAAYREALRKQREEAQRVQEAAVQEEMERIQHLQQIQETERRQAAAATEAEKQEAATRLLALAQLAQKSAFVGDSRDNSQSWPMRVRITSLEMTTGALVGEVEWPTEASVHRIEGSVVGDRLTFTETQHVKKGNAALGCTYTLTPSGSRSLEGTYRCSGFGQDGQTSLTLQ